MTGTLHEPNTWTVGIVLVTGVVLLARHPIAHLLGTEAEATPAPVVATNPVHPATRPVAPSLALSAAVPTHAPRDPFRALVTAGGKVLAPQTQSLAAVPASAAPAPAAPAVSCAGTAHRVAAGDTLWTIAARAVRTHDSDRVTLAWHRIYAANRDTIGSNPALLQVGAKLCVPTSI